MNSELSCEFCTFLNERGSTICLACGRSLGLPSVNLNPAGIGCTQCTFQNPNGSTNCGICGMALVKGEIENVTMDTDDVCQICYCLMVDDEFKMPGCAHTFCGSCAERHFTIKIMECGINNFRCPIDVCVSFDELGNKSDFFDDLKLVLRNILDDKTMKVFDDKVGILAIMDKPGFLRCSSCNHGFIMSSKGKMAKCPECNHIFCARCNKKWASGHSQVSCTTKVSGSGDSDLQMYTNATCPQCKYNYFLERGGCMHISCSQCSHEYCEFCFKKITGKGKSCDFPNCSKGQSLHGHHPRNCMYYVREMDHTKLEQLLKKNEIRYKSIQSVKTSTCKVKKNVFTAEGNWVDSECMKLSMAVYNNMCLDHYKWHLGELMRKHNIDPVDAMNNLECSCELRRNNVLVHSNPTYNQPIEDAHTVILRSLVRTRIPYEKILQ